MVGITGYSKYTVVQHNPLSTVTVYYLSAHMGIIKWFINTLVYLYSIYTHIYIYHLICITVTPVLRGIVHRYVNNLNIFKPLICKRLIGFISHGTFINHYQPEMCI